MGRDLGVLQRMELFQFLKAECEDIVVQRFRCAAKKALQCGFVAGCVARINSNRAPRVTSGLALDPQSRVPDDQFEEAAVSPSVQGLVTLRRRTLFKSKKHAADERHQGAFA